MEGSLLKKICKESSFKQNCFDKVVYAIKLVIHLVKKTNQNTEMQFC